MDNVVLTSASPINPDGENSQQIPTNITESEKVVPGTDESEENPVVAQTNTDGNCQVQLDLHYQAHDVALESAKSNGHDKPNGFQHKECQPMEIDDGFENPDKTKTRFSALNRLFLGSTIICFALFLCSIAFIIANLGGLKSKRHGVNLPRFYVNPIDDTSISSEKLIDDEYFNISHPNFGGIVITVCRRGASISNILVPYSDSNNVKQYRSIVLKANSTNFYGSVRFGFDDVATSIHMTKQLPINYPFLNFHQENWSLYADRTKTNRARFVKGLVEIIYEISSSNQNEFMMKTIVSPLANEQIIVDPTNNIYFNLRGYGDLNTHRLNISSSTPINIENSEFIQENSLIQATSAHQLTNINGYFYKFGRVGIGKNFIATLTETETQTNLKIFSDNAGVMFDPFGLESANNATTSVDKLGIRISPKQSPVYQIMSIYGQTLVVYPSQAIHTTWWQFEF